MTSEERGRLGREIIAREVAVGIARGEGYPPWINETTRVSFSDDGKSAWMTTTMQSNAAETVYSVTLSPKKEEGTR